MYLKMCNDFVAVKYLSAPYCAYIKEFIIFTYIQRVVIFDIFFYFISINKRNLEF